MRPRRNGQGKVRIAMKDDVMLSFALLSAIIVCGCLCASPDSGGNTRDKGLQGLKTTTTIVSGADHAGPECLANCDFGCKGDMDGCVKDCAAGYGDECQSQTRELKTCEKACHSVTKTSAKPPNPRTICLGKCEAAFEDGCGNDDLVSCMKGCLPDYGSCMRACQDEC